VAGTASGHYGREVAAGASTGLAVVVLAMLP